MLSLHCVHQVGKANYNKQCVYDVYWNHGDDGPSMPKHPEGVECEGIKDRCNNCKTYVELWNFDFILSVSQTRHVMLVQVFSIVVVKNLLDTSVLLNFNDVYYGSPFINMQQKQHVHWAIKYQSWNFVQEIERKEVYLTFTLRTNLFWIPVVKVSEVFSTGQAYYI